MILEKTSKISDKLDTDFIILKKPLIDLTDSETFDITVAEIQTGTVHDAESLSIHSISLENLKNFRNTVFEHYAIFRMRLDIELETKTPFQLSENQQG